MTKTVSEELQLGTNRGVGAGEHRRKLKKWQLSQREQEEIWEEEIKWREEQHGDNPEPEGDPDMDLNTRLDLCTRQNPKVLNPIILFSSVCSKHSDEIRLCGNELSTASWMMTWTH